MAEDVSCGFTLRPLETSKDSMFPVIGRYSYSPLSAGMPPTMGLRENLRAFPL